MTARTLLVALVVLLSAPLICVSATASHAAPVVCACCACVGPHQKDANAGQAQAELAVGLCYQPESHSCGNEPAKAAYWLDRAARAGSQEAQHLIGWSYVRGAGVPLNLESAIRWWQLSARSGYVPAFFDLAEAYDIGLGVRADPVAAGQWYAAAEKQGYGKYLRSHPELPRLRNACASDAGRPAKVSVSCRVSQP